MESHACRLYSSAIHPEIDSARALLNKIKKGDVQDGCSIRDIYYAKHWTHLNSRKEVEDAIKVLEDLGWVRTISAYSKGRPKIIIQLHPSVQKNTNF